MANSITENAKALPTSPEYNAYVGARYVPIFDGAWSANKKYEPLVIVTQGGNSYTSKTYVPAGVPVTNTNYWALTGEFNAQVEELLQQYIGLSQKYDTLVTEIGSANATINALNKTYLMYGKRVVLYGDSIGKYGGFAQALGEYIVSTGGIFSNQSVSGTASNNVLETMQSLTSFPYDICILQVGVNDCQRGYPWGNYWGAHGTENTYYNNMVRIISTIHSLNKNCLVIGLSPLTLSVYNEPLLIPYRYALFSALAITGSMYIELGNMPLLSYWNQTGSTDGIHPTESFGINYLAKYIIEKINAGGDSAPFDACCGLSNLKSVTPFEGVTLNSSLIAISWTNITMQFNVSGKPTSGSSYIALPVNLISGNWKSFGVAGMTGRCIYEPNYGVIRCIDMPEAGGDIYVTASTMFQPHATFDASRYTYPNGHVE